MILAGRGTGTPAGGGAPGSTPLTIASRGGITQTRLLTPLMAAPVSAPAGIGTRSLYLTPGARKPLSGISISVLGLNANSIALAPFPALAGSDVALTVRLFNSDRADAKKVKVETYVDGDKLGETTVDVPMSRSVVASGFAPWKAKPGRHEVRAVVTAGARVATATKPVDVRPPNGVAMGGVASLIGRGAFSLTRLAMTTADIRLNPLAPAAGAPVDVSVRVQNPGAADVKGVRVELFADGTRLGEVSGTVPAGKDYVFSGLPKWTPASGAHTLLLRASAGTQIVEATRDVTVGAGIRLLNPAVTSITLQTAPSAGTGGTGGTTSPTVGLRTTAVTGMTLMAISNPDLQILPTDITFMPPTPKAGDALTINVTVRNVGTGPANNATVRVIFQVDGAENGRREFPVTIAASGMTSVSFPVTTPAGKVVTAVAAGIIANDLRADNNQAQASTAIALALQRQLNPMILQVQPK